MKATTISILEALANAADGAVLLPLSGEIYPAPSLEEAAAAFAQHCRLEARSLSGGTFLSIEVLPERRAESLRVIGECLNYLLVHAVRARISREPGPPAKEPQ